MNFFVSGTSALNTSIQDYRAKFRQDKFSVQDFYVRDRYVALNCQDEVAIKFTATIVSTVLRTHFFYE